MLYSVYRLKNLKTGKSYVGITKLSLENRWKLHLSAARCGAKYPLHRSIRKHGELCWETRVLKTTTDRDQACRWEQAYIQKYETTAGKKGYNCAPGGYGGNVGKEAIARRAETYRQRYAAGLIVRPEIVVTPERRRAASKRMLGNQYAKGLVHSQATRLAVSLAHKGKILSEKTKKKISETRKRLGLGRTSGTLGMKWVVNKKGKRFCVKADDPRLNSSRYQHGMKWTEK